MGTPVPVVVKIPSSAIASSHSPLLNLIPRTHISSNSRARRCSTGYGGRSGGSRWDSNPEKNVRTERFGFNVDHEKFTDENDEAFGSNGKKRVWWSDEGFDDDDDEDASGEDEFGFREASIGIGWIFKLFRAFGWMVPAIGISMLMGTGTNTFVMALALPLAQSALSLVTEALWGRWSDNPRPKPKTKTKKRPFSRASNNVGASKGREQNPWTYTGRDNYQSWTTTSEASVRKGDRRKPNFGGWDDLDKRGGPEKVPRMAQTEKANQPRQQKEIKLSKRVRNREKPLLLRLLIAVFPFLGSWTKLL